MDMQQAGLYVRVDLDGTAMVLGCQRCGSTADVDGSVAVGSLRQIVGRFAKVHLTGCIPRQLQPELS
jgi:hypothetical protein